MNADDTRLFEMIVRSSALAQENHAIIERAADGAEMIANLGAVLTCLQRDFTASESATPEGRGTTSNRSEARRRPPYARLRPLVRGLARHDGPGREVPDSEKLQRPAAGCRRTSRKRHPSRRESGSRAASRLQWAS